MKTTSYLAETKNLLSQYASKNYATLVQGFNRCPDMLANLLNLVPMLRMGTRLLFECHRMDAGNRLFEELGRTFSPSRAAYGLSVRSC